MRLWTLLIQKVQRDIIVGYRGNFQWQTYTHNSNQTKINETKNNMQIKPMEYEIHAVMLAQ